MGYLGLPSSRLFRFFLLFIIVIGRFLPLSRGTLLRLLFLIIVVRLLGSRRDILLSYMSHLPGGLELLLIFVFKLVETVKVLRAFEGFLDIFNYLGSDAAPMTP